MVDIRAPT
jgi:putative transposase